MSDKMRRRQDGEKKVGRFIRGDDARLLRNIVVLPFSFDEIREAPIAYADNASGNVIRHNLHDESQLDRAVRPHETFDADLRRPEHRRPLLQPLDFTEDWERQRARASAKRDPRYEEDDEFDIERELREKKARRAFLRGEADSEDAPKESPTASHSNSAKEVSTAGLGSLVKNANAAKPTDLFQKQAMSMEEVGRQIQKLASSDMLEDPAPTITRTATSATTLQQPSSASEMQSDHHQSADSTSENREFIAMPVHETVSDRGTEVAAVDEYRRRLQIQEENKQILDEIAEESRAHGYADGYRHGEEKAALQTREQGRKVLGNLSDLVGELEGLKKSVLKNVEENFYEICQALAESLFRREFQINPEAFAEVMQRAIDEAVEDDKVKIRVHPESYKNLIALDDGNLKDKLVADDSVPVGDFKVESSLSMVDGNIGQLIKNLLEQLNLSLFEDAAKDRAG